MKGPLCATNAEALGSALEAGLGIALQPDFLVWDAVQEGRTCRRASKLVSAQVGPAPGHTGRRSAPYPGRCVARVPDAAFHIRRSAMDHRRADFEARVTVIPLLSHRRVGAISALRPWRSFQAASREFEWVAAAFLARKPAREGGSRLDRLALARRAKRPAVKWSRNSTTSTSAPRRRQTEPSSRPMYAKGHKYLTLVYQIDSRLPALAVDRTRADLGEKRTLFHGLELLGQEFSTRARCGFVCSDLWQPYLKVLAQQSGGAIHVLDRFHIMGKQLGEAIDKVRAGEARRMGQDGYEPVLKKSRWCLLKHQPNVTKKSSELSRRICEVQPAEGACIFP